MIDRAGILFPLALLGSLAALSFVLKGTVQLPLDSAHPDNRRPNSILEHFTATRTDESGLPRYRLSAERMNHYLGTQRTELIEPRFTQSGPDPRDDLRVRSSHALVERNGEQVVFAGKVEAARQSTHSEDALTLTTSHLTIFPEQETMQTAAPVTIVSKRWTLSGIGMHVDARKRVFKMLGHVKGSHAPH